MPKGRFLCGGCNTFYSGGESEFKRCGYCAAQYEGIKKLQRRIVGERPHLGRLPPSQLFERLYDKLIELEKKTHG